MEPLPITITSEELNLLIYAYFQDSGFDHSAFALRNESGLDDATIFKTHIARGELINLLGKAMLYMEVEAHWKSDGLRTDCKGAFTLLGRHSCSDEISEGGEDIAQDNAMDLVDSNSISSRLSPPPAQSSFVSSQQPDHPLQRNGATHADANSYPLKDYTLGTYRHLSPTMDSNMKRKISTSPGQGHTEKRARHGSVDMDVDDFPESVHTSQNAHATESAVGGVTDPRPRGAGDFISDPRAVLLLEGHKAEVFVCAFNPRKHNLLASGSKDSVVNLWNLPDPPPWNSSAFASGPPLPLSLENVSRADQGDLTCLTWNSAGTLLAIGSYDTVLRVYTASGDLYFTNPLHEGPIFSTRFSKDDKWLLSGSLDGSTCVWDINEKALYKQYHPHKECCLDIEWIDNNTFASCGADMTICIQRIEDDEPFKRLLGHKDEINQIKVNPSGTRLASCSDDGTACVWKVDNLGRAEDFIPGLSAADSRVVLRGHSHSVSGLGWCVDTSISPTGHEMLVSTSFDGSARLWDSETGSCLAVFTEHRAPVYALTFSPDGKFLATGSGDGWMHIYDLKVRTRIWSWYAGKDKPGVFEIGWQKDEDVDRIAVALECRKVALVDMHKVEQYRDAVQRERRPTALIEPQGSEPRTNV
ncbi:hypothetical protein D9613_004153 [Agrocybe pediades]|uniref:WD40 repeat-like protein n=1 Tax=Agrocybe pediades TaxID=84607 RepID=A0A8H4QJ76_9AGAR|nr:hypothetical protein D9613_004153 [Agrocybe pediades]